MNFQSILFRPAAADARLPEKNPDFFGDLNLDQLVAGVAAGRPEYGLEGLFRLPVPDIDGICYRQAVFRDLETPALREQITAFARQMRNMRDRLNEAEQSYDRHARQRWFLDAAAIYCDAVITLTRDLETSAPKSAGFRALHDYLAGHVRAQEFSALAHDTKQRQADLADIEYCTLIKGSSVTVSRYQGETNYGAALARTFERFKQGDSEKYPQKADDSTRLDSVEVRILQQVAKLYPEIFAQLDSYCTTHRDYLNDTVARFDHEIQFYMAYRHYMATAEEAGLLFCYPQMSDQAKTIHAYEAFDLLLAHKLISERMPVITNDFHLREPERLIVVSGPNQGGKTTFARLFGQLHYLARLGCPAPGREACLFQYDRLFTHFERSEDIRNLRGKLEDDLVRIHEVLAQATADSIIIMNEIFSSTTTQDARFLGEKVLRQLIERQALCVCVTFIDELASLSENTVSMASTVEPENPAVRTFKIVRQPADGLAYARSLAEKHGLTRAALRERL